MIEALSIAIPIVGGVFLLLCAWYLLPYLVRSIQVKRLNTICREKGLIVLTYDDGPSEKLTPRLLEELKSLDVPATFFIPGNSAIARPDGVRAIEDHGHHVGSHSQAHHDVQKCSPWRGILDCVQGIRGLRDIGVHPKFFRPPYGKATLGTVLAARFNRCPAVWWTHDSGDTGAPAGRVSVMDALSSRFGGKARRAGVADQALIEERAKPESRAAFLEDVTTNGGVILFHDSDRGSQVLEDLTIQITRDIVEHARAKGKTLATLDHIL